MVQGRHTLIGQRLLLIGSNWTPHQGMSNCTPDLRRAARTKTLPLASCSSSVELSITASLVKKAYRRREHEAPPEHNRAHAIAADPIVGFGTLHHQPAYLPYKIPCSPWPSHMVLSTFTPLTFRYQSRYSHNDLTFADHCHKRRLIPISCRMWSFDLACRILMFERSDIISYFS